MILVDKNWSEFSTSQQKLLEEKTIFNIIQSKPNIEERTNGEKKMIIKFLSGLFPFKQFPEHIHKELYKSVIAVPISGQSIVLKQADKPNLSVYVVFKGSIKQLHDVVKRGESDKESTTELLNNFNPCEVVGDPLFQANVYAKAKLVMSPNS